MLSKLTLAGRAAVAGAFVLAASSAFAQMGGAPQQTAPSGGMQQQPAGSMPGAAPDTMQNQSAAGQPVDSMPNASTALASATVQDATGQPVGQVKSVKTSSGGTADSVAVSLTSGDNSGKVVNIKADKLTFDPSSNVVKSTLTIQEIDQLPTQQSP